jgi:hypothetical protein
MNRINFLHLCLFAVAAGVPASAETFDYSATDGFSITIPAGWQQIPPAEIQKAVTTIRKTTPNAPPIDFRHGFQRESGRWFSHPYILVVVDESGRTPQYQLDKLDKVDFSKEADTARSVMGNLVSNFDVAKAVYDPPAHIVWLISEATYPAVGKVGMVNGAVLTERGSISVYGYALRDSFDAYKSTFIDVAKSVRPIDSLRYKPRLSDNGMAALAAYSFGHINWSEVVGMGVVGALIGGAAGAYSKFKKKPK